VNPPSVDAAPKRVPSGSVAIRALIRVARFLVLFFVAWGVVLFFMQRRMLYLPHIAGAGLRPAEIAQLEEREGLVRHWLERDRARIEVWLFRVQDRPSRGLVAFAHGNGELIDHALDEARRWRRLGFDVVLPEYRSYGRSTGEPSESAIVGDALAAIEWALDQTTQRTLVLHGRSLGTGVVAQVAARLTTLQSSPELALIVLEAPFTSIASFAPRYGVPEFIVRDPFRTDRVLPTLHCPVLILHARSDEIVPIEHGQTLASLVPTRGRLVAFDGTHNSGISTTADYWRAIADAVDAR
jgi:pimeloyl-ACP methyl ester carboxylesterase